VLLAFANFLRKSLFRLKPMIKGRIFREAAFFGDAVGLDLDRVIVCRWRVILGRYLVRRFNRGMGPLALSSRLIFHVGSDTAIFKVE
jgi:hypothetical protein